MTPTTVEPEIVAAAWRRLLGRARRRRPGDRRSIRPPHRCPRRRAGGRPRGRIQRDVRGPLPVEPAVQLLRIVPKKLASGAPIDGVVVSAGIPELDEAVALIESLQADGPAVREFQARHRGPDSPGCAYRQRPWPPPPSWFRSRAVKPAATTAGKRWMTCLPPPTPKCAPATTSCWSPAAASAPLNNAADYISAQWAHATLPRHAGRRHCLSVPPR